MFSFVQAVKAVKGTLNKLTPEKFERLLQQLVDVVKTAEILHATISLVFESAVAQPTFVAMYADLCDRLSKVYVLLFCKQQALAPLFRLHSKANWICVRHFNHEFATYCCTSLDCCLHCCLPYRLEFLQNKYREPCRRVVLGHVLVGVTTIVLSCIACRSCHCVLLMSGAEGTHLSPNLPML